MRPYGQTKLGFFPLPLAEAKRLKNWLIFPERFSAVDPCVGDGVAFTQLLQDVACNRYGIEVDANRAEQAKGLGVETLQADTMDVRCPPEAVSLLYLNPPYDWEAGESNNQRLESVFLEHTYRWLKVGGVLLFVIPQMRLAKCARLLSEQFADLRVLRLTEPACLQVQPNRSSGNPPQATCPSFRRSVIGRGAISRKAFNKSRSRASGRCC